MKKALLEQAKEEIKAEKKVSSSIPAVKGAASASEKVPSAKKSAGKK